MCASAASATSREIGGAIARPIAEAASHSVHGAVDAQLAQGGEHAVAPEAGEDTFALARQRLKDLKGSIRQGNAMLTSWPSCGWPE